MTRSIPSANPHGTTAEQNDAVFNEYMRQAQQWSKLKQWTVFAYTLNVAYAFASTVSLGGGFKEVVKPKKFIKEAMAPVYSQIKEIILSGDIEASTELLNTQQLITDDPKTFEQTAALKKALPAISEQLGKEGSVQLKQMMIKGHPGFPDAQDSSALKPQRSAADSIIDDIMAGLKNVSLI